MRRNWRIRQERRRWIWRRRAREIGPRHSSKRQLSGLRLRSSPSRKGKSGVGNLKKALVSGTGETLGATLGFIGL